MVVELASCSSSRIETRRRERGRPDEPRAKRPADAHRRRSTRLRASVHAAPMNCVPSLRSGSSTPRHPLPATHSPSPRCPTCGVELTPTGSSRSDAEQRGAARQGACEDVDSLTRTDHATDGNALTLIVVVETWGAGQDGPRQCGPRCRRRRTCHAPSSCRHASQASLAVHRGTRHVRTA